MTRLALGCALLFSLGCAGSRRPASGILLLHLKPPEARVLLDDRYIGSAAQLSAHPLKLDAGLRRLEISAEGCYGARREARVLPAGRVELSVELLPIPEGARDLH